MENEKSLDNLLEKFSSAQRKSRLFNLAATTVTIIGATILVFTTVVSTAQYFSAQSKVESLNVEKGELNNQISERDNKIQELNSKLNNHYIITPPNSNHSPISDNSNNKLPCKPCDKVNGNINRPEPPPDNSLTERIADLTGQVNRKTDEISGLNDQLNVCQSSNSSSRISELATEIRNLKSQLEACKASKIPFRPNINKSKSPAPIN